MGEEPKYNIPFSGKICGEIMFWVVIAGMIIGTTGLVWHLSGGPSVIPPDKLVNSLMDHQKVESVWRNTAGEELRGGHWYLRDLGKSDALAMLGVSICCLGAVFGSWGAFFSMFFSEEEKKHPRFKLYLALMLVLAIFLTISVSGFTPGK